MLAFARPEETHTQAGHESAKPYGQPVPNTLPAERVRKNDAENYARRGNHHQRECGAGISTVCDRKRGKKKKKPESGNRRSQVKERRESDKVRSERNPETRRT